jgi:hypothetical protein
VWRIVATLRGALDAWMSRALADLDVIYLERNRQPVPMH